MQDKNIKKKASTGLLLLGLRRVVFQLMATVSNIFLARLLFPGDFGTYATIIFVFSFIFVFTDIGLGPSIIQKKGEITLKEKQTAISLQLLLGLLIFIVIYFIAPILVGFWKLAPGSTKLLRLYSLIIFAIPFKSICSALLERELEYKKLISIELLEELTVSISSVIFAYFKFGVISFIYGVLIGKYFGAILYYFLYPFQLRLCLYKEQLKKLMEFGLSYQTNVFLGLFTGSLIYLYLSKVVGTQNMGYFQFAQGLAVAPLAVPDLFNRITFPATSRLQGNKILLRSFIERAILINTSLSFPISMLLLLFGDKLIHFIYTDKWLPSLPALYLAVFTYQIMSFTGVFSVLLYSFGKVKIVRNLSIVWVLLTWMIGPVLIGKYNFWGMSLTTLIVTLTSLFLIIPLRKEISFSIRKNVIPPFISVILTSVLILLLHPPVNSFWQLAKICFTAGIIYSTVMIIILRKRLLKEIILPVIDIFQNRESI